MRLAEVERDVVILVCATSAGIHAALAPAHFVDGTAAGLGFAAVAAGLAVVAVWSTRRPSSRLAVGAAAALLAALLASYGLAASVGLPVLHPHPEPVDGLGLATKAVEAVGLLAAAGLAPARGSRPVPLALTALVAVFSAFAALAVSTGHDAHARGQAIQSTLFSTRP